MKLWDGSYLSTKGVRRIYCDSAFGETWVIVFEDGEEVGIALTNDPVEYEAAISQIEAFAKEAGLA